MSDYVQAYDYDNLGRAKQVFTSLGTNGVDGEFSQFVTYDEIGRVYQEIDATYHGVQYEYNSNGYLSKLVEASDSGHNYYQVQNMDQWGNVSQALLGNGLTEQHTFVPETGLPDRTLVTNAMMDTIQDNEYTFDAIGTLTNRDRYIESTTNTLSETFYYDELNRLTEAAASGLPSQTFTYDITGNMTSKSDVGTYSYGASGAGPHAVTSAGSDTYTYDAAGNMLTGGGRTVTYNTFNKPTQITKGGHTTSFEYGPDRSRYKRVDDDGTVVKTTLYVGNLELITRSSGPAEVKRYIGDIAVLTDSTTDTEHYLHKDSLGSTDIVTDSNGMVVAEMSFDAFGKRRNLVSLANLTSTEISNLSSYTTRGYTGHETLDEVEIIHMNGRIYDPLIARFLSADPIITDPSNLQKINRYSYVLNSPLVFTDPSGFIGECTSTSAVDGEICVPQGDVCWSCVLPPSDDHSADWIITLLNEAINAGVAEVDKLTEELRNVQLSDIEDSVVAAIQSFCSNNPSASECSSIDSTPPDDGGGETGGGNTGGGNTGGGNTGGGNTGGGNTGGGNTGGGNTGGGNTGGGNSGGGENGGGGDDSGDSTSSTSIGHDNTSAQVHSTVKYGAGGNNRDAFHTAITLGISVKIASVDLAHHFANNAIAGVERLSRAVLTSNLFIKGISGVNKYRNGDYFGAASDAADIAAIAGLAALRGVPGIAAGLVYSAADELGVVDWAGEKVSPHLFRVGNGTSTGGRTGARANRRGAP